MKIVIQCAGRKRAGHGRLRDEEGNAITFVARPDLGGTAPPGSRRCRPDDPAGPDAGTWRDVLVEYNRRFRREGVNPDRLLAAGDLYSPPVYRRLVAAFGPAGVFVLSARWGLVRADFLLPAYDITLSAQKAVPGSACRDHRDAQSWRDFNHLADAGLPADEPVHFFGGRDYLPAFYRLADALPARKVVHHKAAVPHRPGYEYRRFAGPAVTNWHYPAAEAFARTPDG